MEKCRVKMTESYPAGCKGWRRERLDGCIRCENCIYFSKNYDEYFTSTAAKEPEKPNYYQNHDDQKLILGTWARQFVSASLDELE